MKLQEFNFDFDFNTCKVSETFSRRLLLFIRNVLLIL